MRIFFIILVVGAVGIFTANQVNDNKNPLIPLFVSWGTSLIIINMISGYFLYYFSHSIKEAPGEEGLKGVRGLRGREGNSQYCDFKCN